LSVRLSGNMSVSCSYFTPGSVTAWMSDHLRTGKPPRCRTRYPGHLSLSHPFMGRCNEYPAKAGEQTGTPRNALARVCGLAVLAGVWLRAS